jgi:hypothetical protein
MLQTYCVKRPFHVAVLAAALSISGSAQEARSKGAILERLEALYVPTQTNDDKSDIVTAGSILTLKQDNLITVGLSTGSVCPNTFKDGKITVGTMAKITCGRAIGVAMKRKVFLAGQKLWVTNIDVKDGGVVFELYTDAYAGERYKATLTFPLAKGALPAPAEVEAMVAQVFKADPPPPAAPAAGDPGAAQGNAPVRPGQAAFQPQPGAGEAPPPPIDAPPPPPAEPPTIKLGMTAEQVVASLGQPQRVIKLPTKEIYSYKDLKITFVNNKVTDVQ